VLAQGPAKKWEKELLSMGVDGSEPGIDGDEIAPLAKENVATPWDYRSIRNRTSVLLVNLGRQQKAFQKLTHMINSSNMSYAIHYTKDFARWSRNKFL
jgi:hypothetical protein